MLTGLGYLVALAIAIAVCKYHPAVSRYSMGKAERAQWSAKDVHVVDNYAEVANHMFSTGLLGTGTLLKVSIAIAREVRVLMPQANETILFRAFEHEAQLNKVGGGVATWPGPPPCHLSFSFVRLRLSVLCRSFGSRQTVNCQTPQDIVSRAYDVGRTSLSLF